MERDSATHAARFNADRCCDFPHEYPPMNRKIHDHKVSGLNEATEIIATDMPGAGGANHIYDIHVFAAKQAFAGQRGEDMVPADTHLTIKFQNGPIGEAGFNGIGNEALMAVLIDRLRGFQYLRNEDGSYNFNTRGKYACRENAEQLTLLETALMWAQKRTRDRLARGVEGTHRV